MTWEGGYGIGEASGHGSFYHLDVGLCELDTADGPYNKTGYQLERREDGFAITVGLMEYISGWSAFEILYWLHEKQAIQRRYDNARRQ